MSIRSKLTLLLLILPIGLLVLINAVAFYFYKVSIDVSSLGVSAIVVIILVWLRDSCLKKLEYIHTNFLIKLYRWFSEKFEVFYLKEIGLIKDDSKRYGRFTIFYLYPKDLLKCLEDFLYNQKKFYEKVAWLKEESLSKLGLDNVDLLLHFLKIKPLPSIEVFSDDIVKVHQKRCLIFLKQYPDEIAEIKKLMKEIDESIKTIKDKLESFMKENTLEIPLRQPSIF